MRNTVFMLLSAALLLVAGCKGKPTADAGVDLIRNPQSADGYKADTQMPVLTFDRDSYDFGRISAGESISYSFHFVNTGTADLVISSCSATCASLNSKPSVGHLPSPLVSTVCRCRPSGKRGLSAYSTNKLSTPNEIQ